MVKDLGRHAITWGVQRRGPGWVGVVYLGESPVTDGHVVSKSEARVIARKRAAYFRGIASNKKENEDGRL